MRYPELTEESTSRQVTDTFLGYNHNIKIRDGEFYNTENLTSKFYPMLAIRQKRSVVTDSLTAAQGMIEKDALGYVDNGTLYYNSLATPITGLKAGRKQLVSMGAYICIFPDKMYYNTIDSSDYGSMEASYSFNGTVKYEMCNSDGSVYGTAAEGSTAPTDPEDDALWIDTANGVLKQYSVSMAMWVTIETVYTKLTFSTQGQVTNLFKEYDGVELTGARFDDLNGSKIIYGIGGKSGDDAENDFIVVIGVLENEYTDENAQISIKRTVPDMDYVCECQNRLWGCRYGNDGTQNLNELYCCALGDFKNWRQYLGLSTDSWTASVGSDGVWTGCINFLGSPVFFKENRIHRISVSSSGAHSVSDTPARGVQQGSDRSLAVVDEVLYYKSRTDVCAWQGGFPEGVSSALGDERYYKAVAGAFGRRYYISMEGSDGEPQMFCYDISKGLWMREDGLRADQICRLDDSLYCLSGNAIYDLNGLVGSAEGNISWFAETGIMYYEYPDKKYISRYNIRLRMAAMATLQMGIEYDSSGEWELAGRVEAASGTRTVTLPVCPRRCDHMRLRLSGTGDVKIFSIARLLEKGSDM